MKMKLFIGLVSCFFVILWTGCEKEPDPEGTSLEYVYGDNQLGYITLNLSDSLVVRVLDQNSNPFPGLEISFAVDSSIYGSLTYEAVTADSIVLTTDSLGYATVIWTLGSHVGTQYVTVTANGLTGSPITFSANGIPWMQDSRDGQYYRTVTIGSKVWMAENLNYSGAPFTSFYYTGNPSELYGRLYTWDDAATVCPSGWHLPTEAEFTELSAEIGGSEVGSAIKSITDWSLGGGNNLSGLNVYPAGEVNSVDTSYSGFGSEAGLWSTEVNNATSSWRYRLFSGSVVITKGIADNTVGLSCRCIED